MPEGDTIFRTATALRRWLLGRTITAARTTIRAVPAASLIGETVDAVDTEAKHLLIRFASGRVLHTHMRMTGSWHVYRRDERWRAAGAQARLVLESDDRVAVCFNAPVIELLDGRTLRAHPVLGGLGPDILTEPTDVAEICRRAALQPFATPIGEVLLDQRIVGGIGNIWRSESLFLAGVHPRHAVGSLDPDSIGSIVTAAARLMLASSRRAPAGPRWVYARGGRPCRRCGTVIVTGRVGTQARTAYWCPRCQPSG